VARSRIFPGGLGLGFCEVSGQDLTYNARELGLWADLGWPSEGGTTPCQNHPIVCLQVALTDFLCVARTVGKQDGRILIRI